MVTDTSTGDFGWSIDNVSFTGITVAPFSSVVAEDGVADNAAPVAVAGDDAFIAVGREATLDGSDSTDDVGIESFAWVQTGGPEVELTDADTAAATFTPTELGEYSFALTVTDERQVSTTDEITLTVIAAPIANAGADQETRPFRDVRLDGRGSSAPAPGSTLTYAWVQTSGPTATLTGATTATPTFRTGETGAYVFRLRVTDSQSRAVSEDFVTVNATIPAGGSFGYLMLLPGLVAVWLRRRRQIGK
ncbi:MAG: PKD domain-containing protein [Gammaproteobacteria bacterium]|nr:PKD domain-containing protein [Gammaproteobacteria bacterium]